MSSFICNGCNKPYRQCGYFENHIKICPEFQKRLEALEMNKTGLIDQKNAMQKDFYDNCVQNSKDIAEVEDAIAKLSKGEVITTTESLPSLESQDDTKAN